MGLRSKLGKAGTVVAATAVTGPIGGAAVAAGWVVHKIVKENDAGGSQPVMSIDKAIILIH